MTLIYLSCAWVAGIFLGARLNVPWAFILIGLIPLPLIFSFRQHRKTIILVSLCLFAFFGGSLRFQASQPAFDENHLSFYNEQETIVIKGMVNSDPEVSENTQQLQLSVSEIEVTQDRREVSGTALLFVPRYSTYQYGDRLLVTGKLNTPSQLNDFDYPAYLAQQGIYSTMLYPQIEILERDQGLKPVAVVYAVRNRISQTLTRVLPEPQAALAQGITMGIRGNIPTSLKDDFSRIQCRSPSLH